MGLRMSHLKGGGGGFLKFLLPESSLRLRGRGRLKLQRAAVTPRRLSILRSVEPLTLTAQWCGKLVKARVQFK